MIIKKYYPPSDTFEDYDTSDHSFIGLRDPSEYNTSSEGYTPFGDE